MVRNSGAKRARRQAAQTQGASYRATSQSVKCQVCNNQTLNPSGRCYLHEGKNTTSPTIAARISPIPTPLVASSRDEGVSTVLDRRMSDGHTRKGDVYQLTWHYDDCSPRDIANAVSAIGWDAEVDEHSGVVTSRSTVPSDGAAVSVWEDCAEIEEILGLPEGTGPAYTVALVGMVSDEQPSRERIESSELYRERPSEAEALARFGFEPKAANYCQVGDLVHSMDDTREPTSGNYQIVVAEEDAVDPNSPDTIRDRVTTIEKLGRDGGGVEIWAVPRYRAKGHLDRHGELL